MHIFKTTLLKESILQRTLDNLNVPNDPSSLPFNNIFGDNWRIAIPLFNSKIQEIINMLENGSGRTGTKYRLDIENEKAYKTVKTEYGEKEVYSRLGKIIRRELGKEWADEWSRQMSSENLNDDDDKYMIIISRHPYDIIRMSDHNEWSSCHSPGDSYFNCAIEEASDGGPIAYVVNKSDYDQIADELQSGEIFKDKDRHITGINPLSRLRINRYEHEDGEFEVAVPATRLYGREISGFKDTLNNYMLQSQEEIAKKITEEAEYADLTQFGRYGGTYVDSNDASIFKNFFGETEFGFHGNARHVGEGEGAVTEQWQEELEEFNSLTNNLKYQSLIAEVSDDGPYLMTSHSLYFEYSKPIEENIPMSGGQWNYIETNLWGNKSSIEQLNKSYEHIKRSVDMGLELDENDQNIYNGYPEMIGKLQEKNKLISALSNSKEKIKEEIRLHSDFYVEELEFELRDNKLEIRCDLSVDDIENPDDYSRLVQNSIEYEKDGTYATNHGNIYKILVNNSLIKPLESETFLQNYQFQNLNFKYNKDNNSYNIDMSFGTVTVPEEYYQQVSTELYNMIYKHVNNLYLKEQQDLLFDMDFPEMTQESLPQPKIKLENDMNIKRLPNPQYEDRDDGWRYTKIVEEPTGFASFTVSFELPIFILSEYDSPILNKYLRYLDQSYPNIQNMIHREIQGLISKYSGQLEASNWYNQKKIAHKNWYHSQSINKDYMSLCSNCGLVYRDNNNIANGKPSLTKEEEHMLKLTNPNLKISHGICKECCLELYGEELCKNLLDEDYV